MRHQPIHLVCLLDLNRVAQAEGPQEQLLAALGRREGGRARYQPGAGHKTPTATNTRISYLFRFAIVFQGSVSLGEAIHLRKAVFVLVPVDAALDELHAVLRQRPGFVREHVLHLQAPGTALLHPQPQG